MEQMYEVVADVSNYYKFVPYVQKSYVHSRKNNQFKADVVVGFPPLKEVYTSTVTENKPYLISSECKDGRLFNYLLNEWKFNPGVKDIKQSCVIDFKVAFEFKSILHRRIANLFFDIICDQMENAFKAEAKKRFGTPSIKSHVLFSYKS